MKLDKDIPIPLSREERVSGVYRTMKTMEVGDSFLLPNNVNRNSSYVIAKYFGIKVTVRSTPEGVRVWRLPDTEPEEPANGQY